MAANPTASWFRRAAMIALLALLGGLVRPARADEADEQYAVAAGHYAVKRWKLAADEFRTFLSEYPDHARANQAVFLLGEALVQLGKYEEAGTQFRRYLSREPDGPFAAEALFRAGESAYLSGDRERARSELKRFLAAHPEAPSRALALPYLGDLALGADDVEEAERYFRQGLERFPQGPLIEECRFGLAQALERRGKSPEAERLYRSVAANAQHPLADDAQFHLGALLYATGKHEEAIRAFAAFDEAFRQSPWRAEARLGTGWALQKLGRLDQAKQLFEGLVSDAKVGVEALYWLAMVQKAQQDYAAAAKTLLRAAAAGPQHELIGAIRFHAGDALRRSGDLAGARKQFDALDASTTPDPKWGDDALWGKIQIALAEEDHAEVDRLAARFRERFADSSLRNDVARMQAQSLLKRKEYGRAQRLLEPLIVVGVSDEQTLADRYLLAQAYQGQRRYDQALSVLLPVIDAAEGQLKADAQLTRGTILLAMQRYADAVEPLETFLKSNPAGDALVKARGELAICYARSGRVAEAKAQFARLVADHPHHELLGPIIEQLAEAAYAANDTEWSAALFARLQAGTTRQEQWKGLSGLGWSQYRAGELAQAAATFQKLLDKDPPAKIAAEAALVRGRILEKLQPVERALAMYDLVIDQYAETPEHPEALLAAARLRHRLKQDREAAALYERLVKDYPRHPEPDMLLYEWAWVAEALGQPERAAELFERIHREHRGGDYWADATFRLAKRAFDAKDYEAARRLADELLAAEPPAEIRESALNLRGRIAVAQEDWATGRGALERLIEEFPQSRHRILAEYWLADMAYREGKREEAARRFEQLDARVRALARREGWMAMVPLRRAQVLAQMRRWKDAYRVAAGIEAQYPGFPLQYEADYVIGLCLATQADFEGARRAYEKVIESEHGAKTETAAMAEWMIGETFFHQKNYAAALRRYLRLRMRYDYPTWQALALLQAGKCREKLGEPLEAAKHYAELIETFPDSQYVGKARELLEALPPESAGADGKSEYRNPKSETNPKSQVRNGQNLSSPRDGLLSCQATVPDLGHSDLGFVSDFVLRISDFEHAWSNTI